MSTWCHSYCQKQRDPKLTGADLLRKDKCHQLVFCFVVVHFKTFVTVNAYSIKYSLCKKWYVYERCCYTFALAYSSGESEGSDTISSNGAGTCMLRYFTLYGKPVHDNQNVRAACRGSAVGMQVHTNTGTATMNRYYRNQALI